MPAMKMFPATETHVETISFTPQEAKAWKIPDFQRGLKVNQKVLDLSEQIKADGGVIPGIICFGILDKKTYLIDGQQRREAFILSGREVGYADARYRRFHDIASMSREYVNINSHLVNMKPDDILRGLEKCLPAIQLIRKKCHFVGYDCIRRSASNAILSMSIVLRAWAQSRGEVPGGTGTSAATLAETISEQDAAELATFLNLCMRAWGRDAEFVRLWGFINLALCMWLYRRLVISPYSSKTTRMTDESFTRCLSSLSASPTYCDWLVGRMMGEHNRAPCYSRIKTLFAQRILEDSGKKAMLPAPTWAHA